LAGTGLKYKPGTIMGGRINQPYDCGVSRSIGYFLEPLIVLCLFAKEPLTITLKGCTFICLFFLSFIIVVV
jgi:RNA 3'-terminal phosphate cyclase-like protein